MSSSDSMSFAEKDDVNKEIDVMKKELNFLLNTEVPAVFKDVALQIQMISGFLMGEELKRDIRSERINLVSSSNVEGLKCSLAMHYNELRGIEINFKPTPRHNNYMYKSREDTAWVLYQVTNCCDIIKSLQVNVDTINYKTYEQAVFNVDRLLDSINAARNILLFPKKRNIYELQSQKNMRIFPLVPNDLVFSFYIQGHKLLLAIYVLKGNETQKHILKCETISWLNNVIVLLTNSLNVLQQLKDKLSLFGQIVD